MKELRTLTFQDGIDREIYSNIASEGCNLEATIQESGWYRILEVPKSSGGHLNITLVSANGPLQSIGIEYSGVIGGRTAAYQTHNLTESQNFISEAGILLESNNLCSFYVYINSEEFFTLTVNYSGKVYYNGYKSGNIINALSPEMIEEDSLYKIPLKPNCGFYDENEVYINNLTLSGTKVEISELLNRIAALESMPQIYTGTSLEELGNKGKVGDIFIITSTEGV